MQQLLTTCTLLVFFILSGHAQYIKGQGAVVRAEIELDDIQGVNLGFAGDIYIKQGKTQRVEVEAQQNIIDALSRKVRGGVWYAGFGGKWVKQSKGVKVFITMPTLRVAKVSGSGNLSTEGSFSGLEDVEVGISGSGNVMADIEAKDISGGISGSGNIKLRGDARSLDMSISGSGDIRTFDLRTGRSSIKISGSGGADVWAEDELTALISGSGNVRYKGNASVKARVSGSGKVVPAG